MLSPQRAKRAIGRAPARTKGASEKRLGKNAALNSVIQLQSELDLPRIVGSISGGSDFAEVRIGEIGGTRNCDHAVAPKSGIVEVGMVENIEEFSAKLKQETLAEPHVLEGREIQALKGHSGNLCRRTTQSRERAG